MASELRIDDKPLAEFMAEAGYPVTVLGDAMWRTHIADSVPLLVRANEGYLTFAIVPLVKTAGGLRDGRCALPTSAGAQPRALHGEVLDRRRSRRGALGRVPDEPHRPERGARFRSPPSRTTWARTEMRCGRSPRRPSRPRHRRPTTQRAISPLSARVAPKSPHRLARRSFGDSRSLLRRGGRQHVLRMVRTKFDAIQSESSICPVVRSPPVGDTTAASAISVLADGRVAW